MNKLESLIKFKIGYYDSLINVFSAEDPDKNQKKHIHFRDEEKSIRASFRGLS